MTGLLREEGWDKQHGGYKEEKAENDEAERRHLGHGACLEAGDGSQ